jgi:flagellum-specific ATP synthase
VADYADKAIRQIGSVPRFHTHGRVRRVKGLVVEVSGLDDVALGEGCVIGSGTHAGTAEVVGFDEGSALLMPYGPLDGLRPGVRVSRLGSAGQAGVGDALLGRVINAMGEPLDGRGPIRYSGRRPLIASAPNPMERARITEPLPTHVRAIDGLLTLGRGQRTGIFAGSGVGKSVLLGMIARRAEADVNVIALLGERGREVREFIERDLGPEGLARSIVIVATGDESALLRARGGLLATAIAEHYRDLGQDVLLMVDSITRVAMAWREIGLAAGEAPATKGYPPSVFAALPRLLERAGTGARGSITGLYTVLVEGEDFNEPVADASRAILDGHIVLSRKIAATGHFPAIDILDSRSRVRDDVITEEHRSFADAFVAAEAAYRDNEDIISIGQYKAGVRPQVDRAIANREEMLAFLRQRPEEGHAFGNTAGRLAALGRRLGVAQ